MADDVVAGFSNQEGSGSVRRPRKTVEAVCVGVRLGVTDGAPAAITIDPDTLNGYPPCWRDFEDGAKQGVGHDRRRGSRSRSRSTAAGVSTVGAVGDRPAPSQADKRIAEIKTADRRFITVSLVPANRRMSFLSRSAETPREYWLQCADVTRRLPPICTKRKPAMTLGRSGKPPTECWMREGSSRLDAQDLPGAD